MDLNYAVYSFVALFLIVDAVGNVPIFLALLEPFKSSDRDVMIRKAVAIAAVVLLIFTIAGNHIFSALGIEIYSFKIAGGILLLIISIEMLFGRKSRTESSAEEEDDARRKEDIAITPMAVPLLTGPGAITTGIVLFNSAKSTADQLLLILDIMLVFLVSYIILIKSRAVFDLLGATGTKVVVRLMGLLLSSIAVQFITTGVAEAVKAWK